MPKLKCEIELDKDGGITVTVLDSKGGRSQSVHLDGSKITLKVKGKKGSSTIVQEEGKVTITAKEFEVKADKISLKAKKKALLDSKGTVTVKSARDTKVDAKGSLKLKATRDVKVSGMGIAIKGKTKADLSAAMVKVKGKAKVELGAPMVDVNAKALAKLQGAIVQAKAKAILQAEASGLANVKGALTNVAGMLVKLG